MKKPVLRVLALIFALGVVVCSGILIWRGVTARRSEAKLQELRQTLSEAEVPEAEAALESEAAAESEPEQASVVQPSPAPEAEAETEAPQAEEEVPQEDAETTADPGPVYEMPQQDQEPQLLARYADLAAQYPDFAGWITIGKDDIIDAPVVRGADNDFYLDHDFTGASAWGGAIFMDCQDGLEPLSQNTILYGHHLADQFEDRIFGELMNYKNQDYAFENQSFYFASPYQEYEATIFACYAVYPSDWRLYSLEFTDGDDFLAYCQEAKDRSLFDFGVTIGPEDRIITLSTCDYTAQDYRFLVHAVLRPLD